MWKRSNTLIQSGSVKKWKYESECWVGSLQDPLCSSILCPEYHQQHGQPPALRATRKNLIKEHSPPLTSSKCKGKTRKEERTLEGCQVYKKCSSLSSFEHWQATKQTGCLMLLQLRERGNTMLKEEVPASQPAFPLVVMATAFNLLRVEWTLQETDRFSCLTSMPPPKGLAWDEVTPPISGYGVWSCGRGWRVVEGVNSESALLRLCIKEVPQGLPERASPATQRESTMREASITEAQWWITGWVGTATLHGR